MLGVVFLSEYNELIHAFGNNEFRDHFTPVTAKTGHQLDNAGVTVECDSGTTAETARPTSSSSSGISSSTSTTCSPSTASTSRNGNRTTTRERTTEGVEERSDGFLGENTFENEEHRQLDDSLLLQQLMPLVVLCRAKQQQNGSRKSTSLLNDNVESIFCPESLLHIRISCLPHSNLLVLIHGQSIALSPASVVRLFASLLRCVRFHYGGPSLQLIPLRSAFVRLLNMRCERRMLRLLSRASIDDDNDDAPFCQNANFGGPSRLIRQSLLPLLKEMSRQFAACIGRRCRCLFLHSDRLIASVSSHNGERTAAALCHDDFRSLLQFARQSPPDDDGQRKDTDNGGAESEEREEMRRGRRKSHVELGTWLYSKSCRRRQLHNVFVFSLNDRVEMICAAPTEHFQLISTVWEALDSVDKLADRYTQNLPPSSDLDFALLLGRCDRLLANEQKMLDLLANNGTTKRDNTVKTAGQQQFPFLDNVPRTQRLIKHHWDKLRGSIDSLSSVPSPGSQSVVRSPPSVLVAGHPSASRPPSSSLLAPFVVCRRSPVTAPSARAATSVFVPRHVVSRCASNNQCTVSSTSSTFAHPLTHSSALFSSSSFASSRLSATFLDAIRSQFRRVQRSLLDELLGWNAFRAHAQTLPSLQMALHRSLDSQMGTALAQLDDELCPIAAGIGCLSPLKPTILGFDMMAYKCVRVGSPSLCLHYVPEENAKQMLNKLMLMDDDLDVDGEPFYDEDNDGSNAEEITFARTSEGELLIRLCHPINANGTTNSKLDRSPDETVRTCVPLPFFTLPSSSSLFAALTSRLGKVSRDIFAGQSGNSSTASYRCTVLFSPHTNTSLATRQTSALIATLSAEMEKNIVSNFY